MSGPIPRAMKHRPADLELERRCDYALARRPPKSGPRRIIEFGPVGQNVLGLVAISALGTQAMLSYDYDDYDGGAQKIIKTQKI